MEGKTNNTFLKAKIILREKTLPNLETVRVLDAYAGNSIIWKSIIKRTKKDIQVTRIDKEKGYKGVYLRGENLKYFKSLDLTDYDIIDLDAYGVPYNQLHSLFRHKFKGVVYITFIQSMYGGLNKRLLNSLGFPNEMINKCPTLFNKNGFAKFKSYLSINGVKKIKQITRENKHYIQINI